MINPKKLMLMAKLKESQNRKFFKRLKDRIPRDLDAVVHDLHDIVFAKINCLDCANCCKQLGPRITEKDIDRLAKFTKLKKEKFIATYLRIDGDNEFVFQNMPCPFLLPDHYCSVYDIRPKACKGYPHTDQRKFHKIFSLTLKNIYSCPAVFEIVEELKKRYS